VSVHNVTAMRLRRAEPELRPAHRQVPGAGTVRVLWRVVRHRKGGDHTLAAIKSIRDARPDGAPVYVIVDNLSANITPAVRM
jgi:hypothetical protein